MNVYIVLSICFLPFLAGFFLYKWLFQSAFSTGLIASLLGLAPVLPIAFIQFSLFDSLNAAERAGAGVFIRMMIYNGLIEEFIKALLLFALPVKKIRFQAFFGAALLSGLCLGCLESMIYVLEYMQKTHTSASNLVYSILLARIFSADAVHMLCAGLGGLFVYSFKTNRTSFMPIVFAVLVHGLYDFFIYLGKPLHYFAAAAILFAAVECRVRYEKLKPQGEECRSSVLP
ncbi:MAG: PrsW family glutamic-type intramembrane protease [Treponema sp.]